MAVSFPRRALLVAGSAWALASCSSRQDVGVSVSESPWAGGAGAPVGALPSPSVTAPSLDHHSPASLAVLVNKHHPLEPLAWAPEDLVDFRGQLLREEVAQAAEEMFVEAAQVGFFLLPLSGYRSFEKQEQTYAGWVASQGQELADTASARPGFSEHQTGLALDVGTGGACDLQVCFGQSPEAAWLAENCHRFGFILRFPWWQHEVTGYWYESWHFRYLGRQQAWAYRESGAASLEEFWGFPPAPSYL